MKIEKDVKLLFIGDSITDADRLPEGEGLFAALGNGYVSQVNALLGTVYHDYNIRVVNKGISGNTVKDLQVRWHQDVVSHKPDWLSVMIGINDVWRQFDLPHTRERHVSIDEYEKTLNQLLDEVNPTLKGLVLMTPYYIEANGTDPMRAMMDDYGLVVRRTAERLGAVFVDTQAAFNLVLRSVYPAQLAWDRVHPTATGTMIIAKAFLDAIGFDWNRNLAFSTAAKAKSNQH